MDKNITILPEFYFSEDIDEPLRASFFEYHDKFKYEDSSVAFPEIDAKIERLRQIIITDMADRLGVDVTKRLPPRSKIHFMDPPLFSKTILEREVELPGLTRSLYSINVFNVFVRTTDENGRLRTEGSLLRSLCHEFIHSLSYKYFTLVRLPGKNRFILQKDGYHDPHTLEFNYLTEAVSEMTVYSLLKKYIKNDELLSGPFGGSVNEEVSGYSENVIILNAILMEAEEKGIETYGNLLNQLYSGFILGTGEVLEKVKQVLGTEKFEVFKNLKSLRRNWVDINLLARELGLEVFLRSSEGIESIRDYQLNQRL